LYEVSLEGILLFAILWVAKDRELKPGSLTALFLILYGTFRFAAEFFREPDAHLGLVVGPLSMGQVLSAAMLLLGVLLLMKRRSG
jgi:phosphatidylglycerol:prolipoprotein diacylglycerol transferase